MVANLVTPKAIVKGDAIALLPSALPNAVALEGGMPPDEVASSAGYCWTSSPSPLLMRVMATSLMALVFLTCSSMGL